ncbi:crotonobetainyl-CoA:carnitine CoA-transferase CaiB-like acyl-CoA transferase [Antricoccus suffuscus]|uniref:Crotonobetainyl-CoA:carnitine CoA-transferase CaiB-like acyl-CoA transferase n=1 Tax=Antricoccus suffuscus TaxID=1629062 RepID=A0A2T1A6L8_9ACTN|nr:CoA transferase [Antricoccus suffuscus]PRZ44241.1 crotonobetainyl-CoA:carnitine CoA-transferase CaiB-like acyl-CoA transferase [Antricoccus suffuscus]
MSSAETDDRAQIADQAHKEGPLAGIRVLDLTRVVMGPLATQVLADQGADVILVEANGGDTNRVMGPGPHPELSGVALNLLRNKRSIDVDLKSEEGMALIHRLVKTCDVVMATMRPQVLTRLGLDYESLSKIKPDLVYCQAQGWPMASERAEEPAYDDIIQAASGVSDALERIYGEPGLVPTIFADKVSGLVMAQSVSAALFHRERTGEGQHIEVPMQQATSAFMLVEHGSGAITEPPLNVPGRPAAGYQRILSPERRPHRTKDGEIHIFPYLPKHYVALFSEAGMPDAENDPRYADKRASLVHSDSLYRDIRKIAPSRTTAEWLTYCKTAGIPATDVASLQDLVDALPLSEHPTVGKYRVIPAMANFGKTPIGVVRRTAPLIGQDTDDVIAELDQLESDNTKHRG